MYTLFGKELCKCAWVGFLCEYHCAAFSIELLIIAAVKLYACSRTGPVTVTQPHVVELTGKTNALHLKQLVVQGSWGSTTNHRGNHYCASRVGHAGKGGWVFMETYGHLEYVAGPTPQTPIPQGGWQNGLRVSGGESNRRFCHQTAQLSRAFRRTFSGSSLA